jgi:hypothetical protein
MTTTNTTPTGTEAGIGLDKLEALLSATTPGEWLLVDRTVYSLEHDGWRKGVEQFRNRFSCSISRDGSGAPEDELVANAEFIVAAKHAMPALIALARRAAPLAHPIGQADPMPGASGFTMACFKASDVPVGTKLYLAAPSSTDSAQAALNEWHALTDLPPDHRQVLVEFRPHRNGIEPVFGVARYFRALKGVHDGDPGWGDEYGDDVSEVLRWKYITTTAAQAATQGDKS